MGYIGDRLGPNKVSFLGILQPLGDALKLSQKDQNVLFNYSFFFYYSRVLSIFLCAYSVWMALFFAPRVVYLKFSFVFFLIFLRIRSLNFIFCGWRTWSKYGLLGALRSVCLLISYEALIYVVFFFFFFYVFADFNFSIFYFFPLYLFFFFSPLLAYFWIPAILAEINRTPFDFSEGERELVRGFNIEHSSLAFTLIFLREYAGIIFFSVITSLLFFFSFSVFFFFFASCFFIVWVRRAFPRFRFDKFLILAWKFFLPSRTLLFLLFLIFVHF